jgi:drug/metabolite transporter (DMT)-like permease
MMGSMLWIFFALITAFSEATKDLFSKRALKNVDPYVTSWSLSFFSFLFLTPSLLIFEKPIIGGLFWQAILIQGVMLALTTLIYMSAIRYSPLSVSLPMLAFTPAFMLITSPLILGEQPSFLGISGILLIVIGAYFLNVQRFREGPLTPFKALTEERGPLMMLFVAFIWSVTANIDKIGVINSSPLFYSTIVMGAISIGLTIMMLFKSKDYPRQIKNNFWGLLPIGFFFALGIASQMTAIELTLAPFVISVKRTSILVGSIYGFVFFHETNVKERVLSTLLMLLGLFIIAWT